MSFSKPQLERTQRIALARLISDLIEADFIVEEGEMAYFEHLISKDGFRITTEMLAEAKRMNFAKAVEMLKKAEPDGRQQALRALRMLSMSDGTSVPLEAIQLFAVEQALEYGATIYSVPATNVGIANMKAIYVESELHTDTAASIERDFRSISHEFTLSGFDFVVIPHVAADFREMDPDYLVKTIRYMIPSVSDARALSIARDLRDMTTARFCRDVLDHKLNIPLTDVAPSLLIKINESDIIVPTANDEAERKPYANFLLLPLSKTDVLTQVRQLLDHYRAMVSGPINVRSTESGRKFLYYGFHRSLFDLIAYGNTHREYRLVFDFLPRRAEIYFESIDSPAERISLRLNPQESALYYLIALQSTQGEGLDWRDIDLIPADERQALLDEFNRAYARFGKGNTALIYKDRTQTNHIRNQIRALGGLDGRALFMPENTRGGGQSFYRIQAGPDRVDFRWPQDR